VQASFEPAAATDCLVGTVSDLDLLEARAAHARVEAAGAGRVSGVQLEMNDWARRMLDHRSP
jgi:hypothetical protein